MKTSKIKNLVISGAILMATSLVALGQSSTDTQTNKDKQPKSANSHPTTVNQGQSNSIFDAGSSAQVRHDRIGSLCPEGVSNVGKNSVRSSKKSKPSKELNGLEQNP